jgi:predicted membrane-bound mannosyltransferase
MFFDRTFHPDEANQAFTVGKLLETGGYHYKPTDHHGPTLYYAAAPLQRAFGHSTTAELDGTLLRCTPLVFGVFALVFGALAIHRLMKKNGDTSSASWLVSALFVLTLGTSPMFVFFATDFIQETLLAAFFMMAFWTGTEYFTAKRPPCARMKPGTWALLLGIACGLMFATKETCVLSFAAAGLAGAPLLWLNRKSLVVETRDVVLAVSGFMLTSILFFSSFATNWSGVYNAFIAAPFSYLHRAAGDAASEGAAWHVHPWWQYLKWLFADNGILCFFTICGFAMGIFSTGILPMLPGRKNVKPTDRNAFVFLAAYSVILLSLYSFIPYKTPWCAVQILVALIPAALLGFLFVRKAMGVSGFVLCIIPASAFLVFAENIPLLRDIARNPDSREISYNYAHSSPEVRKLAAVVAKAMSDAEKQSLCNGCRPPFIAVALPPTDTWPFPCYNRALEAKTGYWTKFEDLVELQKGGGRPTVVIVPMTEGHLAQALFPHLKNTRRFYIRPGVRVRVFW